MKKTYTERNEAISDNMLPEYNFDYDHAHPNRFAEILNKDQLVVILDEIAKVLPNSEQNWDDNVCR